MPATSYRNVRRFLQPRYRNASDRMIERVVEAQGLQASAIEDFWDDVGNFVASALPAVGGAIGSVIAPGVGTAIGAGLGSAAGGALHSAIGPGQPAAPAAAPTIPLPAQQPGAAGAAGSSQQMTALLLQLLSRPELLQALMQMLLGTAGNRTVTVPAAPAAPAAAATQAAAVPVSAFTNLLSSLAGQISEAYNAENAFSPAGSFTYGAGPWGSHVDMASADSRGAALMELLRESGDGGAGAMLLRRQRKQRLTGLAQALQVVAARRASGARA